MNLEFRARCPRSVRDHPCTLDQGAWSGRRFLKVQLIKLALDEAESTIYTGRGGSPLERLGPLGSETILPGFTNVPEIRGYTFQYEEPRALRPQF